MRLLPRISPQALQRIKNFVAFATIAVLLSLIGHANAQTIKDQAYWITDQTDLTLQDLESADFKPYQGVLNKGYGDEYIWLRLKIVPSTMPNSEEWTKDWIIRIRPTYLGEIVLFDTANVVSPEKRLQPQRFTGQRHASNNNGYDSINHGFLVHASNKPRDIYLRLKTSTTRLINVEVLSPSKAYANDRDQLILNSVLLSGLAFFLIWALLQWLIIREPLLALFLAKQGIVFTFGITYLGYLKLLGGADIHWPIIDSIVKINNFAYIGILYLFEITFLSHFVTDKRYCRYAYLGLVVWLSALILYLAGFESLGLKINMYVAFLTPALLLFLAAKTKPHKKILTGETQPLLSRRLLVFFYLFYVLATYLIVLPNIGLIQAKEFMLNAGIYVSIVSAALMTTLLIMRTRKLNLQKIQAEKDVELAQQKLTHEQVQREQQSRFISMLAHELKTPISVALISLDAMHAHGVERDRIQRALQNMNDVVERCRISDALEGHRFEIMGESFGLREAVFERIDLLPSPDRISVFEGDDVFITSDAQLVSIMIANLLDNALKYSPEHTQVQVRIAAKANDNRSGVSLKVINQIGPVGIPDPERAFLKYYRSKAAGSKSGSGLGLYLTKGIAQLLNGTVSYRATDTFIEFELWLPG